MKINKRFLLRFFLLFIVVYFFYIYQINSPKSSDNQESKVFVINSGDNASLIANNLKNQKLIRSSFWFKSYLKNKSLTKKIVLGSFDLSASMNIAEIAKIITTSNKDFSEKTIILIEGWNLKQTGEYLVNDNFCTEKEWDKSTKKYDDFKREYSFLKEIPRNYDLEGYVFPDTYRVFKNATCLDIVDKTLSNFENKFTEEMKKDIKSQKKTVYEILTMASIIEKEVRSVKDMKVVSGIFWNRIKNGQALESCATLAYILGENKKQYSYEDTNISSPYNTYKNRGLTPGPISNPGLNAIQAAIYPTETNYNYFLTDLKTGNTIFSKTFEEHKNNKWKYLN